jgi:2,5-dioxopentanoate dehydrogenase
MPIEYQNYIGGEWREADTKDRFEVNNPATPDEVVATFPRSSNSDAEAAVVAAANGSDEWAAMPGPERGRILRDTARILESSKDELASLLTREEGKTLSEASGEVQRAIDIFDYYGQKAADFGGTVKQSNSQRTTLRTRKEPMGVAALITPWNYPIAIPSWKLGPALATGNTVVIKPASIAPTVGAKIVEALDEAGIPEGAVNLVTGPGSVIGSTFVTHDDVNAVSFTGSSSIGHHVYDQATDDGKRIQTEMGGKNPTVVMPSADLNEAIEIVGAGAFGVTGQACTACSRAIVHEDVYDEFCEGIVEYAESLNIGPGIDDPDMGPQVSQSELNETLEYVDIGQQDGAELLTGQSHSDIDGTGSGFFVEPAVFGNVTPDMRIAQEEVFGPVLAVIPVSDYDEAVAVSNRVDYGLVASIVTQDLSQANDFVVKSEAGIVKVNEKTTGLELHVPFGGMKNSSSNTYREQGDTGLDFFTTTKTAYINF